jgi:hypothetical protein
MTVLVVTDVPPQQHGTSVISIYLAWLTTTSYKRGSYCMTAMKLLSLINSVPHVEMKSEHTGARCNHYCLPREDMHAEIKFIKPI